MGMKDKFSQVNQCIELCLRHNWEYTPPIFKISEHNQRCCILCRHWKRGSHVRRFVTSTMLYMRKFTNGLTFHLTNLGGPPLDTRQRLDRLEGLPRSNLYLYDSFISDIHHSSSEHIYLCQQFLSSLLYQQGA